MKARDDDGVELDAEFEVERTEAGFDIIFRSRGGSDEKARNSEYAPALRLILRRMADQGLVILEAQNASTKLLAAPEQRRLILRRHAYPIRLAEISSIVELQGDLGNALATFGHPPGKTGGNPTKRLRLSITGPGLDGMSGTAFERMLTGAPVRALREVTSPKVEAPPLWTEGPTADPETLAARVRKLRLQPLPETPPAGASVAQQVISQTVRYSRLAGVVAWVLAKADGCCEVCNQAAPFIDKDGIPFLEVHHVRPLAEGGPDIVENAVAACPNCHRRLHYALGRSAVRAAIIEKIDRLRDYPRKP